MTTTITHNGTTLTLTQDAYIAGDHMRALAHDSAGNQYLVRWDICNPEQEEAEDLCDWSDYSVEPL